MTRADHRKNRRERVLELLKDGPKTALELAAGLNVSKPTAYAWANDAGTAGEIVRELVRSGRRGPMSIRFALSSKPAPPEAGFEVSANLAVAGTIC